MYATILSPLIEKLNDGLLAAAAGPETLVVTHANASLVRRLRSVFAGAAVVDYPQSCWDFGTESQIRELAKLLTDSGVTTLIIVGDSSAFSDPQMMDSTPVMQRAKSVESGRLAAQRNFARQVEAMIAHPQIAPRLEGGSLEMKALLYRAETGAFVNYHLQDGIFEEAL